MTSWQCARNAKNNTTKKTFVFFSDFRCATQIRACVASLRDERRLLRHRARRQKKSTVCLKDDAANCHSNKFVINRPHSLLNINF